jgi:hypothetical protein
VSQEKVPVRSNETQVKEGQDDQEREEYVKHSENERDTVFRLSTCSGFRGSSGFNLRFSNRESY